MADTNWSAFLNFIGDKPKDPEAERLREEKEAALRTSILQKLNAYCERNELEFCDVGTWSGGNDEGYFDFTDEPALTDDETEFLEGDFSAVSGYCSFAGSYQTSGTLQFIKATQCIHCVGSCENQEEYEYGDSESDTLQISKELSDAIVSIEYPEQVNMNDFWGSEQLLSDDNQALRPNVVRLVLRNGPTPHDYNIALAWLEKQLLGVIKADDSCDHYSVQIVHDDELDIPELKFSASPGNPSETDESYTIDLGEAADEDDPNPTPEESPCQDTQ